MYPLAFALAGLTLGHAPVESFEFAPGRMDGWEGDGYYLTCGTAKGPGRTWGVCTSDAGAAGRKAQLNRSFKVEDNVTSLRGRGFINLASGCTADHRLDMVLLDENKVRVPKQLFTASGWVEATGLMPRWKGLACEYLWDLTSYRGQTLKLVIRDLDDRPGCHLYASGFHLLGTVPTAVAADGDFASFMQQLEDKHTLLPMHDYKSKRFRAIGNASQKFSIQHLKYCEIFYDQFVNHFRARGFAVQPPADKQLMIAIFSEPKGFEAYLGRRMPPGITGVYHTLSNRLVLYDLSQNAYLLASRDEALKRVELFSPHDRMRVSDTVERRYKDAAKDANIGTTMHECAHLLSFNSGLLQRGGDVPVWLAEGLATYCESTDEGDWQSLGSPNPMRIHDLRRARGNFLSVQDLMRDNWLNSNAVLLGYAQSWALYHMLMKERPAQLNKYLQTIAARRVPEYRLADFVAAFGDVQALEQRYRSYMNDLIQRYPYRDAR
jgi:hypothetical protein